MVRRANSKRGRLIKNLKRVYPRPREEETKQKDWSPGATSIIFLGFCVLLDVGCVGLNPINSHPPDEFK